MRRLFFKVSIITLSTILAASFYWPEVLWSMTILGPLFLIGFFDAIQTKQAIRRNFPVIGNLRYIFELIRPELQQYFVESNQSGRPIPREIRSVVYQRAKGQLETQPFGTQLDVHQEHYEWVNHAIVPVEVKLDDIRIKVGAKNCKKPYSASLLNISAMSYGALSSAAISALNLGAKEGRFAHNTGEGGVSPYHLLGGDLIWQIGTGYFGCRTPEGHFSPEAFKERASLDNVKMIEIKLSQGAKPGKGGILPGAKVNKEVAGIRLVTEGKDCISPSAHSEFSTPIELLQFVDRLQELSGRKPVGIKLCVGKWHEFLALCKAMVETGLMPDFITVDGGEGGTGAAPLEFANHVGTPLEDGLTFVVDALRGFGLKDQIRVIAAGKVFTPFDILKRLALGADMLGSARGMMLALGCIQALRCNSNECPAGVATTDRALAAGLHVPSKKERVRRFHHETVHHFVELLGALGLNHPGQIQRSDVHRRMVNQEVRTLEDIHPSMEVGALLDSNKWSQLPSKWKVAMSAAHTHTFKSEPNKTQKSYLGVG